MVESSADEVRRTETNEKAAHRVRCATCGAEPGEVCRTYRDGLPRPPHDRRVLDVQDGA